jgi:uncharacterized protein with GYD domain
MPTYVLLVNWTDQGVRTAKDTVDRYEASRQNLGKMGVTIRDTYWTIGPYDIVSIAEAPDDETMTGAALAISGEGNVRTTTLRAFTADETRGIVAKVP